LQSFSIYPPEQLIKSRLSGGSPQWIINLINYSITIETMNAHFNNGLFPVIKAPPSYKDGISNGKLKGEIINTGPYGNLYPYDYYPKWSPETINPRHKNLA